MALVKMQLEGSRHFIDEPGEWACGEDNMIYLFPTRASPDPNAALITAVREPRVFDIRGVSTAAADIVRDVTIANMSIIGSGWLRNFASCWESKMNSQPGTDPSGIWANTREAMVRVENATDIVVQGCALRGAGTSAIWMEHFAQRVTVENNWIEDVGFVAVMANGWDVGGGSNPIPGSFPFETALEANVNFGHVIRNNFMHNVGVTVTYGAAVYIHQAHSIVVSNNVMSKSPRNLVSVFGIRFMYTADGGEGPYGSAVYPHVSPHAYAENITFFSQYDINVASNITVYRNDISKGCSNSQDCGLFEAWGPGRDNVVAENVFHDAWGGMASPMSIIFPDDGNAFLTVRGNVLHDNVASGIDGKSPGGSSGMGITMLKGYRETFTDNIVADSAMGSGIWIGQSGGFSLGAATCERNILTNWSLGVSCGGGETSQSDGTVCYRDYEVIATSNVGQLLLDAATNATKLNPAWWGFSAAESALPAVISVDRNVYDAPLEPANGTIRTLRPDISAHSIGGATEASVGFERTPYSQWWNRTHLDYALGPGSVARGAPINIVPTDVTKIGLDLAKWPFDPTAMFARDASAKIEVETPDRVFGLYSEPGFGISFPLTPGVLPPLIHSNVAVFNRVDFQRGRGARAASPSVTMRVCTPSSRTNITAATSVTLREGAPHGPLVATISLSEKSTARVGCGYLPGGYWAPGNLNDDPDAMVTVDVPLATSFSPAGRKNIFLSVNGGGFAAIDWFWFDV